MKERPILFSGPMAQAILEGRKMQTRRIVKGPAQGAMNRDDPREEEDGGELWLKQCPFGQPGDRLWVRESWSTLGIFDKQKPSDMDKNYLGTIRYKADGAQSGKLRPSIFMPRWASRIMLEIVSIRVERLQDISKEDAIAEGLERSPEGDEFFVKTKNMFSRNMDPRDTYRALWCAINGYESWGDNSWVWVIEFRRVAA
ncbi:MAG: hypothetical protein NT087_10115 [Deltaproteobacteria bacterium]|nr:hypothetical protein [Deltaproteobacteria bacterium]